MDGFILNILPQGSLSSSVFTTVWVGVCVVAFFNLRFGWVLSGLVVPGYLAPLILTKPWSASVILVEAILTYLIVWIYSEKASKYGWWGNFFGRDRFFALLVVSVLVRLCMDVIVLPEVGRYLVEHFHIAFDYRNSLYSFGLIVVALMANQFWKPGFIRGLGPMLVTIGLTLLIVRYVLMEFTNFSLANLTYMYEDLAVSMLASPKAYIVLLTTCLVASRMNLLYGWEYNGILIPSLLALLWYDPPKIAASFAEAILILGVAKMVLRLPLFQSIAIEGARKILLFFNISFAYKILLAYLLLWYAPHIKISDYYGFGYLLPSLLAIKMHDKDSVARIFRATLQTSLIAIIVASFIGYGLTYAPNVFSWIQTASETAPQKLHRIHKGKLVDVLLEEKVTLYKGRRKNTYIQPTASEIEIFSEGLRLIRSAGIKDINQELERATSLFASIGYEFVIVENRYALLRELLPYKGWGLYVINLKATNSMLIQVPAPLDEWATLEAGASLFLESNSKSLAVAGTSRQNIAGGGADVLSNSQTLFLAFQRIFGGRDILQVRGYTASSIRVLTGIRKDDYEKGMSQPESSLWVKKELPPGLNLAVLESLIGEFNIKWVTPPLRNTPRTYAGSGIAELMLNRKDRRTLLFKPFYSDRETLEETGEKTILGHLQDWLLVGKVRIAEKGSNSYITPRQEELLFFDQEILTPLIRLSNDEYTGGQWTEEGLEELKAVAAIAAPLGFRIIRYKHTVSDSDYLILAERESDNIPHWGTYVIRLGRSNSYLIQVPRPVFEVNVFEYGVALFERLKARYLMIGGAHPRANDDGTSDLIKVENKQSFFTLASQVAIREAGDSPMMVLQSRAFGIRPDVPVPDADIILAFKSGIITRDNIDRMGSNVVDSLEKDGLRVAFVDGSEQVAGYEVGGLPQALYLNQSSNKDFAIVWLSPALRAGFRQQTENILQEKQFAALGIPSMEGDVYDELLPLIQRNALRKPGNSLVDLVRKYMASHDIVLLDTMKKYRGVRLRRIIDLNSKQAFIELRDTNDNLLMLANLFPLDDEKVLLLKANEFTRSFVDDFVASRAAILIPRGEGR